MTRTDTFFSFLCGGCGGEEGVYRKNSSWSWGGVPKTRVGHGGGGGSKKMKAKYGGYT